MAGDEGVNIALTEFHEVPEAHEADLASGNGVVEVASADSKFESCGFLPENIGKLLMRFICLHVGASLSKVKTLHVTSVRTKKPLSTLDIASLAGITRMHAYRLAPQIPGAVRARVGAAWRFPDSPALRAWVKARQIGRGKRSKNWLTPLSGIVEAVEKRRNHVPVARWSAKERRMFLAAVKPILEIYARLV